MSALLRRLRAVFPNRIAGYLFVISASVLATLSWINYRQHPTHSGPDSREYHFQAEQSFGSAHLWRGWRPPATALHFKIAGNRDRAIGRNQTVIFIVSWVLLLFACLRRCRTTLSFAACCLAVLGLALCENVQVWNLTTLSESLGGSLLVLTLALIVLHHERRGPVAAVALAAAGSAAVLTRLPNAYLALTSILVWGAYAGFVRLRRGTGVKATLLIPVLVIGCVACWSIYAASHVHVDQASRVPRSRFPAFATQWFYPLLNVMGHRVLPSPEHVEFFRGCGMPFSPGVQRFAGKFAFANDYRVFRDPALADFRQWVLERGQRCYATFLLLHPAYTLGQPARDVDGWLVLGETQQGKELGYGPRGLLLNKWIGLSWSFQTVLFLLTLAAIVLVACCLALRRARSRMLFPVVVLALFVPHLCLVYHGDALEYMRHSVSARIHLCLALLLLAADCLEVTELRARLLVERWIAR